MPDEAIRSWDGQREYLDNKKNHSYDEFRMISSLNQNLDIIEVLVKITRQKIFYHSVNEVRGEEEEEVTIVS